MLVNENEEFEIDANSIENSRIIGPLNKIFPLIF
jgi:hypothetical protein